jgi:hypothetical protein
MGASSVVVPNVFVKRPIQILVIRAGTPRSWSGGALFTSMHILRTPDAGLVRLLNPIKDLAEEDAA